MGSEFTGVGFRRNQLAGSWCARHNACTANEMQCIHPTNLRRFKRSSSCCRGEKTRTLCSTFEKRRCRTDGFSVTSHYQFQEVSEIISSRSKTRQELSAGFQERDEKEWRCVSEKKKRSCFHGVWKKKKFSEELSEPRRDRPDLKSRCLISDVVTQTHTEFLLHVYSENKSKLFSIFRSFTLPFI